MRPEKIVVFFYTDLGSVSLTIRPVAPMTAYRFKTITKARYFLKCLQVKVSKGKILFITMWM